MEDTKNSVLKSVSSLSGTHIVRFAQPRITVYMYILFYLASHLHVPFTIIFILPCLARGRRESSCSGRWGRGCRSHFSRSWTWGTKKRRIAPRATLVKVVVMASVTKETMDITNNKNL